MHDDKEIHDQGLAFDLRTIANQRAQRRVMLTGLASLSLLTLFGCSDDGASDSSTTTGGTSGTGGSNSSGGAPAATAGANATGGTGTTGGTSSTGGTTESGTCAEIPQETAGPYPGDGSNGANALSTTGIVRSDIRSSFGDLSGTAQGIELTVKLKLVDTACKPLGGFAIYIWHCDRDGKYSLYTVTNQNYLRGVQVTGDDGTVTFTTIFPGCYSGRWPHIHFEIFESVEQATAGKNAVKTSQLALPEADCAAVYATTGYEASVSNLKQTSLTSDMVFADGVTAQLATVSGSVSAGYTAKLTVGISI